MNDLSEILLWEYKKYTYRGYWNILAVFLLYSYLTYLPSLLLTIYVSIPQQTVYVLYLVGTYIIHLIAYTLVNSLFSIAYALNSPRIESCKVSPEPWPWVSDKNFKKQLLEVLKVALFNQIIVIPSITSVFGLGVNYQTDPDLFPGPLKLSLQLLFFMIVEDFCFHWSHKILHTSFFYKYIHKKHHEFNVTISVSSEYAHPLEYLIGNIFPLGAGPTFLGMGNVHIVTWYMWVILRSLHTAEGHSGYIVPWSPFRFLPFSVSSGYHDFHHLKNTGNYSSFFIFWDAVFGDMKHYLISCRKESRVKIG